MIVRKPSFKILAHGSVPVLLLSWGNTGGPDGPLKIKNTSTQIDYSSSVKGLRMGSAALFKVAIVWHGLSRAEDHDWNSPLSDKAGTVKLLIQVVGPPTPLGPGETNPASLFYSRADRSI